LLPNKLLPVASSTSRKVLAIVNNLGIDEGIDEGIEYLNLFAGDTKNSAYEVLNLNTVISILIDGNSTLWQSNTINQYLADKSQPTSFESIQCTNPNRRFRNDSSFYVNL